MRTRWHYLPGRTFHSASAAGVIATAPDAESIRREREAHGNQPGFVDPRPVAWFSVAEPWERSTAMKLRKPDGTSEFVRDMEGNARHGGGLFRIGVAPETAPVSWTDYRKGGFDRPEVCNRLVKAAQGLNADPKDWWASERPVPRELWTHVETWRDGRWVAWDGAASAPPRV